LIKVSDPSSQTFPHPFGIFGARRPARPLYRCFRRLCTVQPYFYRTKLSKMDAVCLPLARKCAVYIVSLRYTYISASLLREIVNARFVNSFTNRSTSDCIIYKWHAEWTGI